MSKARTRKKPVSVETNRPDPLAPARAWFASRGWSPFDFQTEVWSRYLAGESGLVHAPTGMGKTLAVALGPMLEALAAPDQRGPGGLKLLWLTPLRALAADTAHALQEAADGLGLKWKVALRTGDTPASQKKKQRDGSLPNILVTTPESLSVMLSYNELAKTDGPLSGVRCAVVDEWHELLGGKRGVMTELGLARLRAMNPAMRTWGLSATLGNLNQARDVLLGPIAPGSGKPHAGALVRGLGERRYHLTTVLPPDIERFPWAGHLGLRLLAPVIEQIAAARTTLLFTNTRSQSEIWFQALLQSRDDWMGKVAIHHGSLDKKLRARVEAAIAAGDLKCCVCTSSLDLGVDFAPVDQVIQVGSPKGLARFLQRAGRSGHQPGGLSKVVCVPTNVLELLEFAAARDALSASGPILDVESRIPLTLAMDVLVQHMLTLAVGSGFDQRALLAEVRTTHAFADLTEQQWGWAMDYVQRGGPALTAYGHYQRVTVDPDTGLYRCKATNLARMHRMNIGTIMSDTAITVKFATGRTLGSVEEGFIARMKPGDVFAFSGRRLQLVRVREMVATVRLATRNKGQVPSWQGARMSLSSHLASAVRIRLAEAERGEFRGPEMAAVAPVLKLQAAWSRLPVPGVLLIEHVKLTDGAHAFVYPLAGRLVHEGLAALCAYRLARVTPRTFTLAAGDLGFHLHCTTPLDLTEADWRAALSIDHLSEDLLACMNAAQLARRQFREVARVAGLIAQGFPGQGKSSRQLQASSELFFDVFREFDPANLLLDQAQREVLERQLEFARLQRTLAELQGMTFRLVRPPHLTPFGFPLWVDSLREQLSTERWSDRVKHMLAQLERDAGPA